MKDGWYIFILVFIGLILTIFFKLKFSHLGIFFAVCGLFYNNFIYLGEKKLKNNANVILIFALLGNLSQIIFNFEIAKNPFITGNE